MKTHTNLNDEFGSWPKEIIKEQGQNIRNEINNNVLRKISKLAEANKKLHI